MARESVTPNSTPAVRWLSHPYGDSSSETRTLAAWVLSSSGGDNTGIFSCCMVSGWHAYAIREDGGFWEWYVRNGAGTTRGQDDTAIIAGRFYLLVFRIYASNSREFDVWDPTASRSFNATNTVNRPSITLDTIALGNLSLNGGWTDSFDGKWMEAAIWDRALSDDELLMLRPGISPLFLPRDLVFYAPSINRDLDLMSGQTGSVSGTITTADHRASFTYSGQPMVGLPAAGNVYNESFSANATMGG